MRALVVQDRRPAAGSVPAAPTAPSALGLPVVYVPGIDGGGDLLLGTADRIATIGRLVALAYRGEPSDEAAEPTYAQLASSAAAALEARDVGPALLVAESFGVALALRIALDHPERVAGLMLVNGFAYHPWRIRLKLGRLVVRLLPNWLVRYGQKLGASRVLFKRGDDPSARAAFEARGFGGLSPAWRRRMRMVEQVDLRPELASVRQPVSVQAAGRDWIVPSVRCGRVIADGVPDANFEQLDAAGHLILPLATIPWEDKLRALEQRVTSRPTG